jgi:flavin-binding protein dodecin
LLFIKQSPWKPTAPSQAPACIPPKKNSNGGFSMASIAKIIELSADSEKSFDDALEEGIKRASETIRNVRSVWIKDKEVIIENGSPKIYRLHLKVTFKLE